MNQYKPLFYSQAFNQLFKAKIMLFRGHLCKWILVIVKNIERGNGILYSYIKYNLLFEGRLEDLKIY